MFSPLQLANLLVFDIQEVFKLSVTVDEEAVASTKVKSDNTYSFKLDFLTENPDFGIMAPVIKSAYIGVSVYHRQHDEKKWPLPSMDVAFISIYYEHHDGSSNGKQIGEFYFDEAGALRIAVGPDKKDIINTIQPQQPV